MSCVCEPGESCFISPLAQKSITVLSFTKPASGNSSICFLPVYRPLIKTKGASTKKTTCSFINEPLFFVRDNFEFKWTSIWLIGTYAINFQRVRARCKYETILNEFFFRSQRNHYCWRVVSNCVRLPCKSWWFDCILRAWFGEVAELFVQNWCKCSSRRKSARKSTSELWKSCFRECLEQNRFDRSRSCVIRVLFAFFGST